MKDKEFEFGEKAYKSGHTLYFYGDGNLNRLYTSNSYIYYNYKRCVTSYGINRRNYKNKYS